MTGYIMESPAEVERLRTKTEHVLVRRHLSWAGLRAGDSFLDVGCGTGEVLAEAGRITGHARVAGIDLSTRRLAAAAEACGRAELHRQEIHGRGSTPLEAGTFDQAWTRFFLEYQPEPLGVVEEMARLVKPGGKVTLIDVEGNCTRHFGLPDDVRRGLDAVIADLAETGFDPDIGAKLPALAAAAGLVDIRHEIEPYHRIVGAPDARTAAAWRARLAIISENYRARFPHRPDRGRLFEAFYEFLLRDDTMTWSLLHLVQGTVTS